MGCSLVPLKDFSRFSIFAKLLLAKNWANYDIDIPTFYEIKFVTERLEFEIGRRNLGSKD